MRLCPWGERGTITIKRKIMIKSGLASAIAGLALMVSSGGAQTVNAASLTITGAVGSVYSIQWAKDEAPDLWRCVDFVRLTNSSQVWRDAASESGQTRRYRAVLDVRTGMAFFAAGTFKLGSAVKPKGYPYENPLTTVTLSRGFWMGLNHVAQSDYQALMGTNPSAATGDLSLPVEQVNWSEATKYCALLTQRELGAGRIPPGCVYRLPTEAEWEYANQGWTQMASGSDADYAGVTNYARLIIQNAANRGSAQPIPNPAGLYDMHGRIADWTQDGYAPYPGGAATDPQGVTKSEVRVKCGGTRSGCCGPTGRCVALAAYGSRDIGLRVVLTPEK